MVYFFRDPRTRLIKIGRSRFLASRRAALEYEHGRLELLGVIDKPDEFETHLHRAFKNCRMHGEWFEETGPLMKFIAANAQPWAADMDEPGGSRVAVKIDREVYYRVKDVARQRGQEAGEFLTHLLRPLVNELHDKLPSCDPSGSLP